MRALAASTLLVLALAGLAPAAPAADTCVAAGQACVVDSGYGYNACGGRTHEHHQRGVAVHEPVRAHLLHEDRCSDAHTYRHESQTVHAYVDFAPTVVLTVAHGAGTSDAGGNSTEQRVAARAGLMGVAGVAVERYEYHDDARDECRTSVQAHQLGCGAAVRPLLP